MTEISTFRLYLLRAVYLLVVIGMGSMIWPVIIQHSGNWELNNGVKKCMLGAFSILALIGIRYPLQMLPLLFWELTWKTIWLLVVALPLWLANQLDADTAEYAFEIGLVVIVYIAIPWPYVFEHYVRKSGDPWKKGKAPEVRVP